MTNFGADILFPVLVRDADALGIYKALGVPPATVTALKGPRTDIINAINLGRPIPVADGFTGDVITLDAAIDSSFPNGRRLGGGTAPNRNQVNVNSVLISLIVAGNPAAGLAKGAEVNDKNYLDRFPFLAPAHQGLFQGHGGINVPTGAGHPDPVACAVKSNGPARTVRLLSSIVHCDDEPCDRGPARYCRNRMMAVGEFARTGEQRARSRLLCRHRLRRRRSFLPTTRRCSNGCPIAVAPQYRELKRLQAAAAAAPNDVAAATALADAYYRISRSEGDPRFLGYAQAALTPWWKDPEAPTAVLVMRATILQSNHEFARALADLDKAIAREPRNARAILVRATVLTVQGNYDEARADCARLQGLAAELYVVACTAEHRCRHRQGAVGEGRARALARSDAERNARRARVDRVVAGRDCAAARRPRRRTAFPRRARRRSARSLYDRRVQRLAARPAACRRRHPAGAKRAARRCVAAAARARAKGVCGGPKPKRRVATLRARFDASRARGDTVHRREEARFQLQLNGDSEARAAPRPGKLERPARTRRLAHPRRGGACDRRYARRWKQFANGSTRPASNTRPWPHW